MRPTKTSHSSHRLGPSNAKRLVMARTYAAYPSNRFQCG